MNLVQGITPLFASALVACAVSTRALAEEPFLPDLPNIETLETCGSSYNLNLRGLCNISAYTQVAAVYNGIFSDIEESEVPEDQKVDLHRRLLEDCHPYLDGARQAIEGMRVSGGFYLSSDTRNAGRVLTNAVTNHCLTTFESIVTTLPAVEPDDYSLEQMQGFFQPGLVR